MLQSAPPHLRHFIVHLEDTTWCISTPKDRHSLHGCRRCLGKELLLPSMIGQSITSYVSDVFVAVQNIPAIIFTVFGTAVTTGFIPLYTEIKVKKNKELADRFANNVFNIFCLLSVFLTILGVLFSNQLVKLFAGGFQGETFILCNQFAKIIMPTCIAIILVYIYNAYLQIEGYFNQKIFLTSLLFLLSVAIGYLNPGVSMWSNSYGENYLLFMLEEHKNLKKLMQKNSGKSNFETKKVALSREMEQVSGNIVRLESQKRSGYEQYVMQKKGMYLGGYRPFGFLPDPNDCHKLILDPVASQYVRLIFELALQGNRTGTIAKILNEKQIPTPAAYHVAENHVYSEQKAWDLQRSHWTSGTVYHVLKNEKYKGTYVGAKFIMPVPCKHRVLRAPLEQQVRIEDSHAAIVTTEEFEQAQKVIMLQHGNHQAGNYTKHQYPLKGKVYCGYCQKLMKYRVLKKLGPSFNCRFSATAVDSPCKRIPISEELLEHIVRNALTAQIKQAEYVLEILHERERKALICFSALERQEEKLSAEKAEIVKQRVALYEQYADGNMSKEEFIRQRDAYRVQEDEKMEQIQRLRAEKNQTFQPVKKDTDNLQAVMNTVGEAGDVMHLSQNVVETFIDRIEVFNDERVKIRFTFEDVLAGYAE